jgi:TP901 family phage tail tape measure protein
MANRSSEYELKVKIMGILDNSLPNAANMTKRQLSELRRQIMAASAGSMTFQDSMKQAGPMIDSTWNGMVKAAKVGAAAVTAAGAAAVAAGKASVDTGSDFEKAMSSWKATASATDAEYEKAKAAAMEMGRTTTKTASESANALEYMALAGWSVHDSISALPGVLKLSEATGLDLAEASDLVTDSMAATGVQIGENGKGLERFLDIAARANNKSNQTAEQLMQAWIKTGGIFKNLNVDVSESATALGILANRGIKAEEAGTAMKAVMANLTTGSGAAGKMVEKLGIHAFDAEGKFVGLKNLLLQVNEATKGMTEEERNAAFAALGGKRHVDAINDLMQGLNTVATNGKTEWDNLADSLSNAGGALQQMASTKMDNLWGDIKIFQSAMDDTKIRIYDGIKSPLRDAFHEFTQLTYKAGDFSDQLQYTYPTLKRILKESANEAGKLLDLSQQAGKLALSNPAAVLSPVAGAAATITTLKGIKTANDALMGKNGIITGLRALKGSTGGKIVLGVSVAAGAIAAIQTAMDIYDYQQKEKSLLAHFGNLQLNIDQINDISKKIIGEDTLNQLSAYEDQIEQVQKSLDEFDSNKEQYERLSFKAKLGIELSDEEKESMQSSIDGMIQSAINFTEGKTYAIHLSTEILFGDGSKGGELEERAGAGYKAAQAELEAQGKALGDAMSKALEDGMIDIDEQKTIDGIVERINRIKIGIEKSLQEAKYERIENEFGGALTKDSYENLKQQLGEQTEEANKTVDEATETTLAGLKYSYDRGEYQGKGGEEQYQQDIKNATASGTYQKLENSSRAALFNFNTLGETYKTEISEATEIANQALHDGGEKIKQTALTDADGIWTETGTYIAGHVTDPALFSEYLGLDKIPQATRDAISEVWDQQGFEDLLSGREKLHELGYEVSDEMAQGIHDGAVQGALAGNVQAMYELMLEYATNNPEYQEILKDLQAKGFKLPQELADAINGNSGAALRSIDQLYSDIQSTINSVFSQTFEVNGKVHMNWTYTGSKSPNAMTDAEYAVWRAEVDSRKTKKHAAGGIIDSPELAWIGEGGDREYVIPINQKDRSKELYEAAGRDLRAAGVQVSSGGNSVVFSPNVTIQGNADKSTVQSALNFTFHQFEDYMSQYMKERSRVSM